MSLPLKKALYPLLATNKMLDGILARDPADNTAPAILEGTLLDRTPVYPCITWRFENFKPDDRFRPTPAEGGGRSPIADEILMMECWGQKRSSVEVEQIAAELETLLDGQPVPLPDNGGTVFRCQMDIKSGPHFDKTTKAWFVLLRFRFRTHRVF